MVFILRIEKKTTSDLTIPGLVKTLSVVICSVVPGERQITIVCHEKLCKNRLQKTDFQYEEIFILNRNENREQ